MTAGAAIAATPARRRHALVDDERWLWRLMLAPAVLYIVLLVGFPFLLSLAYSVTDVTVASAGAQIWPASWRAIRCMVWTISCVLTARCLPRPAAPRSTRRRA